MNIIEFIEDPELVNDQSSSPAQIMVLKTIYGLDFDDDELSLYRQTTGLSEYSSGKEWSEATLILGRRSGKSDKIASRIAIFEACCRKHELSGGQRGIVMVVASEKSRQARICYDYILAPLESSPILKKLILKTTREEIFLRNGISIQIFPCDPTKVRGFSLIAFIADECAHWQYEGRRVDKDILDAARPGLDFSYSKMIKISTPGAMRGEIWSDFKNFHGVPNEDIIVFQGSTQLFNPTYSQRKLERLKKRKPSTFAVEHLAEFKKDIASMYNPEMISAAVNEDRTLELPYDESNEYFCFVDVAGGGGKDSYAIAIGHKTKEGRIIIDVVRSRAPKFNPDEITKEYVKLCLQYQIYLVIGDKFSGDWSSNAWSKHSNGAIVYQKSERTKSELYLDCEGLFNTQSIEIPDKEPAISELRDLIRKSRSGSKDAVDSYSGQPEDEANVICGVAENISMLNDTPLPEPSLGISEPAETKEEKLEKEARNWLIDRKPKQKDSEQTEEEWLKDLDAEIATDIEKEKPGKSRVRATITGFKHDIEADQARINFGKRQGKNRRSLASFTSYPVRKIPPGFDSFLDLDDE